MRKKANNEGSIYKDKQGHWRGVVTLYSTDGKPKKKYFYGKTKKEVSEKVNQLLSEIKTNTYMEPCQTTLYSWLTTWLDTYARNEIRLSTLVNYETYIHKHIQPEIGHIKLCDLTPMHLQQFYNNKLKNGNLRGKGGLSPKTLRNLHNMLHKALGQAVALGLILRNPTDFTVLPKRKKSEMRYFTVEEQKKLQQCLAGERLGMAILLDLYTGMRMGELLALSWDNVHLHPDGSYIRVMQAINRVKNEDQNATCKTVMKIDIPKTPHSIRNIPLLPEIAEKLSRYHEVQQQEAVRNGLPTPKYVFITTNGNWIDPRDFQRDFKNLLKRHQIREINVHGLRHTFATRALESGMSPKTLSQILGHANVGFTLDTYAHVTESLKTEAIAQMQSFL